MNSFDKDHVITIQGSGYPPVGAVANTLTANWTEGFSVFIKGIQFEFFHPDLHETIDKEYGDYVVTVTFTREAFPNQFEPIDAGGNNDPYTADGTAGRA